jgi:hypothetical protein
LTVAAEIASTRPFPRWRAPASTGADDPAGVCRAAPDPQGVVDREDVSFRPIRILRVERDAGIGPAVRLRRARSTRMCRITVAAKAGKWRGASSPRPSAAPGQTPRARNRSAGGKRQRARDGVGSRPAGSPSGQGRETFERALITVAPAKEELVTSPGTIVRADPLQTGRSISSAAGRNSLNSFYWRVG